LYLYCLVIVWLHQEVLNGKCEHSLGVLKDKEILVEIMQGNITICFKGMGCLSGLDPSGL
jgi:hypothetical protein